jgi:ribonucleoside-triphosphate reductase
LIELPADAIRRHKYRPLAIGVTGGALATAGLLWLLWPAGRALVGYFLYAIPAHLMVSVLANEPALFAAAKVAPPVAVALAGTAGCLVAIVLDYALIGWLVNHRLLKTELDDSRGFQVAQRYLGKAPFVLIALSALLPVPFYPAKILAISRDYPVHRFMAALVLGRMPRFYLLALGGQKVQAPDSALVSAGVFLGLVALWGVWRTMTRAKKNARAD